MPKLDEVLANPAKTSFAANAATGVSVLSDEQTIVFDRYVRVVLPSDGFVFYVKGSLLSAGALIGAMKLNGVPLNKGSLFAPSAQNQITVSGSFHWDALSRQEEAQNYAASTAVFTSLTEVNDLKAIAPGTVWIAQKDEMTFAFSSQAFFYRSANLYHYRGMAVFSDLLTQVVDNRGLVDVGRQVVSNSLPIWLGFNSYSTFYGFKTAGIPLYPSFLVPSNIAPPYGSVHVLPESTQAEAAAPRLSRHLSHSQLTREKVRITFSGARNDTIMDFMDFVNQYTLDNGNLGLSNIPTPRDEKRGQSELNIIAQRKTAEFDVWYNQHQARDLARQLILQSIPTFTFQ